MLQQIVADVVIATAMSADPQITAVFNVCLLILGTLRIQTRSFRTQVTETATVLVMVHVHAAQQTFRQAWM